MTQTQFSNSVQRMNQGGEREKEREREGVEEESGRVLEKEGKFSTAGRSGSVKI